jgi:hypothetical protein
MRTRKTAILAAAGCAIALGPATPAGAADAAPTISAPASRTGFGPIIIAGTAPAGATVALHESAYKFNDYYPAPDFGAGGHVTATANSSGHYTLSRNLDSGFRFYVVANGVESRRISVAMGIAPTITLTASNGTVSVEVATDPAQPGLSVHIQRGASGVWTTVDGGYTSDSAAVYATTLTGQGSGTKYYRAVVDADTENNLLPGQSATVSIDVGSGGGPTPAPTPPALPSPKAGAVLFSKIQYDSPGRDTGHNTSLNNEYVGLTNRTRATINLKGWTVRDAAGNIYRFSTDHRLGAGRYVYVRTGKGTNGMPDSKYRYWNRTTGYVWNNSRDTAYLRTSTGKTIDTCRWTSDKNVTYC